MRFTKSSAAASLVAALPLTLAQTFTDCDPTKKSCPADTGLNAGSYSADFTQGSSANASWSAAAYTFVNYGNQGAEFTISKATEAPTIQTDFYFLFARVDVKMKAAPGTGIVSSIVFESDDLDEIDWEFLGGNTAQVETNFFGKGNTTAYDRAIYLPVSSPQETFHTYTVDWTSERIEWIIDGITVRTLRYTDALTNGGQNYPQTPMRLKLGNWAGGGPTQPEGTIEWAGGKCDFTKGPFTMYVESVSITNYNPATSYEYGDRSGSFESIKVIKNGQSSSSGNSTASASTASATGTASVSPDSTGNATVAPTSSIPVAGVQAQTAAAVSKTIIGSSYSMNTASASAQNANGTGVFATSLATATGTSAPSAGAASPSGSSSSGNGSSAGNSTAGGNAGPQQQAPGTSAASANAVLTVGTVLSVALGFLFL